MPNEQQQIMWQMYFVACEIWMNEVTSMLVKLSSDDARNEELLTLLRAASTLRPRVESQALLSTAPAKRPL